MKRGLKYFLLIALWCISVWASSASLLFEPDFRQCLDKAKTLHRLIFVEYYDSECSVCSKTQKLFETNEKLVKFYENSFVNYRINVRHISEEDSLLIANTKLILTGVPYFLFFDSNKNLLHVSAIKLDAEFLINIGTMALNPNERSAGLENKYKDGDRSIKTLYAYSQLAQLYGNDSLTKVLADDLYKSFPCSDLGSRKSYIIMKNCVNSIDNGFFIYWIKNLDRLAGLETGVHKGEEKKVLSDIVYKSVVGKESEHWNLSRIAQVKMYILQTELSKDPDVFFWERESKLLVEQRKYAKALSIGEKLISKDKSAIQANLYTIRHFLNILSTIPELNRVKQWLDETNAVEVKDKAEILYLKALYYKKTNQGEATRKAISSASKFFDKNKIDIQELKYLSGDN